MAKKGPKPKPIADRFWPKVTKGEGCWEWTGCRLPFGYGLIGDPRRRNGVARAHVIAYELTNGSVPRGLCVLHRCDNPPCVNPAHLFLGTRADNNRDMVRKKRQVNSRKTACPKAHPLSGDNLVPSMLPGRSCLICSRERARRQRRQ